MGLFCPINPHPSRETQYEWSKRKLIRESLLGEMEPRQSGSTKAPRNIVLTLISWNVDSPKAMDKMSVMLPVDGPTRFLALPFNSPSLIIF